MSKLFAEIRRRKVFQTFVPYLGFVWLILQVISVVTPMFNLSPMVNTFVAVVLFAGMPVMLYLSWYFDFTTEGLIAIPDAKTGQVSSFGIFRWMVLILITLGSGALGYRYFSQVKIEFAKQNDGISQTFIANSIAVLPFKDTSADQDQTFLAQGLAEEITSLLGRTKGLKVAASSSTSILADKGLDPVTIAKRLDVATILTGSVRNIGDQLKIRVELINAMDAKVLWSETFSRKFSDVFSVESEIARSTVNMLQDTYIETGSLINNATTKSTDAYVIYLKGREQYRKQTTESMKAARKLFEQAIGLDPEYAQAYVALADTVLLLAKGPSRFGILEPDIASRLASQYLEKSLVRSPDNAEAFAILGKTFELQKDNDKALSAYGKAILLNPSLAKAYMWQYLLLKQNARYMEAYQSIELAYQLDPISIATTSNYAEELSFRGKFDQARQYFEQLIENFSESPFGYVGLADLAFQQGELAQSLKYWRIASIKSPENFSYRQSYIGVLISLGLLSELNKLDLDPIYHTNILLLEKDYDALFKELDFQVSANPDDPWVAFEAGWNYAILDYKEKAIELFIRSYEQMDKADFYILPLCRPALELAWALKNSEQKIEAENFIKICKQNAEKGQIEKIVNSEHLYVLARIAALEGNDSLAAKQLQLAYTNGWRESWTRQDPLFKEILHNTELQNVFLSIEQSIVAEREKALQMFSSLAAQSH